MTNPTGPQEPPPCEQRSIIRCWDHPRSTSHFRVTCEVCGVIGNTERLDELPPCPRKERAHD